MEELSNIQLWIDGQWTRSEQKAELFSPYDHRKIGVVDQATSQQLEAAISAAALAFSKFRKSSRFQRSQLLAGMARNIQETKADFVQRIVSEAGKPYRLASAEVDRAISTFTFAAEEAKRLTGEMVAVDLDAGTTNYPLATSIFVPRGPVLAISPFNFPLNLVAHKVAPALAVGASILLKPPPQAPGAAQLLAQIFERVAKETEVPAGVFQVIQCSNEVLAPAISDSRLPVLSFTGSDKVGFELQKMAIGKKVLLELGGNAAVIVHSDADLKRAAERCAFGAFAYSGQICISIQRIYVHDSVMSDFQNLFLKEVEKIKCGDPQDKEVLVGPLIDQKSLTRILSWLEEGKQKGAKILSGGTLLGKILKPTVLIEVDESSKMNTEEVFGPTVNLNAYSSFEEAVGLVNRSKFGLQAAVFTESLSVASYAAENLDVGGVIINESPTFRSDNMPYGGMKSSGLGREGVHFSMREYCELKTVVNWRA